MDEEMPMFEGVEELYIQSASYSHKFPRREAAVALSDIYHIEDVVGETAAINIKRDVYFEPEANFDVSVTAHLVLRFNRNLPNWPMRNAVEEEIRKNPNALLQLPLARISLLIAEMVSAGGHVPMITPTTFAGVNESGGGL
jgi:hypothetical protein